MHLPNNVVTAHKGLLRIAYRVVSGWHIHHSNKEGTLLNVQLNGLLAKESLRRCLYSVRIAAKEHGIHIHTQNLLLGIVAFKLYSCNPLLELVCTQHKIFGTRKL